MAKVIMVQGTMSNAGKSVLVAGLCRVFKQDGYRVAPFKSQNMALNSFITKEGLEMGRAQVMQAEAAGVEPSVSMNPILLKPTNDVGSQVIVNGEVFATMRARDYFSYKKQLVPEILKAFKTLEASYDIIVIEGAGSPAEINLKDNDIVNMGMAKLVDAPVLLVGDIDRGGVFAQLVGTVMLLDEEEKQRIKGLIINKFRGDKSILDPGVAMLEQKIKIPVVGVTPYLQIQLEDEDSLSTRLEQQQEVKLIDIVVVRYPRLSNFTDFNPFEQIEGVSLRYVTCVEQLKNPDLIILPGTKNTMEDLLWMRQCGMEAAILQKVSKGCLVFGICGGYQMMGESLEDPERVESGGSMLGMGILPTRTIFEEHKVRTQVTGRFTNIQGAFQDLSGLPFEGYEIHLGRTTYEETQGVQAFTDTTNVLSQQESQNGVVKDQICGTYVHGIFDKEEIVNAMVQILAKRKGLQMEALVHMDYAAFKQTQYDMLADALREHMDMEAIYEMMGIKRNGATNED